MRIACAIDIDSDKLFIAIGGIENNKFSVIDEAELDISCNGQDFLEFLQKNSHSINQKLIEREKQLSLNVGDIFINIAPNIAKQAMVSSAVPLRQRKKISASDIIFAKKHLQESYLDWDDLCLHNFVSKYEVDLNTYRKAPLGVFTKKIKMTSYLFWIKDKLRKDTASIFHNLERRFCGFIHPSASMAAATFSGVKPTGGQSVVIDVRYNSSYVIGLNDGVLDFTKEFDFGLKKIMDEVSKKLLLPQSLAEEVYNRYASFKELGHSKEVSIKNGDNYINLSTQTANSFLKEYVKNELMRIIEDIKTNKPGDAKFYFAGRLNMKDGFYDFIKDFLPLAVKNETVSSSLANGCLHYALNNFLENDFIKKDSLFNRILEVYKEYF